MITLAAMVLAVCTSPPVSDGDTIRDCAGQRVRLWGVNSEELSEPGGPEAREALRQLTAGKRVVCYRPPSGQIRDRYGRTVARCEADGRDLAADMVSQGHARDWPLYSSGYYSEAGR